MKSYIWVWLTVSLFFIQGCVGVQCPQSYEEIVPQLDLKETLSGIADELCCKSKSSVAENNCQEPLGTILITDFFDLQTLQPGKMGILMGEMMKSRLSTSAGIRIAQVEFSKYFTLTPQGLIGLTRNSQEIRNDEYTNSECIVGTYSLAPQRLYLFVRRIDMKTGKIVRMADREISWSCSRGIRFQGGIWPDDTPVFIDSNVR